MGNLPPNIKYVDLREKKQKKISPESWGARERGEVKSKDLQSQPSRGGGDQKTRDLYRAVLISTEQGLETASVGEKGKA